MDNKEYLNVIHDVIYLCGCAVRKEIPDKKKIENMDQKLLFEVSERHSLSSIVSFALESAGVSNSAFTQVRGKAISKIAAMEIYKNLLFEKLEEEKIWYMPLKGAVIKDLYPALGMRQMADYDILVDSYTIKEVKKIMIQLGFKVKSFGKSNHDIYFKEPVCNFEIHKGLFGVQHNNKIYDYYKDIKQKLIKDDNNKFGYHFSNEDFYIYNIAHMYKHFSGGGTGIRSLLDIYVFISHYAEQLDFKYISSELKKMAISEWEEKTRKISMKIFMDDKFCIDENDQLEMMCFSGTYGNKKNRIAHDIKKYGSGKKGKIIYVFRRFFIPMNHIKAYYPFIYKYKILIPFVPVIKLFRCLTIGRKRALSDIETVLHIKNKK